MIRTIVLLLLSSFEHVLEDSAEKEVTQSSNQRKLMDTTNLKSNHLTIQSCFFECIRYFLLECLSLDMVMQVNLAYSIILLRERSASQTDDSLDIKIQRLYNLSFEPLLYFESCSRNSTEICKHYELKQSGTFH